MTQPTDQDLIAQWRTEPAPLLPLLHAFHDRDGYLSDDAIRAIAKGLRLPPADLFGTVTFYHLLARSPNGKTAPRVCTGPVCRLRGGEELVAALEAEGATGIPCPGRCDDPIPVLKGDQVLIGCQVDSLVETPPHLPAVNLGGFEECVFADIRDPAQATLAGYRRNGGYAGLTRAVQEMTPAQVIDLIDQSGLSGRGGAGFPTGRKWQAVAEAPGEPKTIVCNADEGEPGCFMDRVILDYNPHAIIEAMLAAAYTTGATRGFIYLRYEYVETFNILQRALTEAAEAGFLGRNILGQTFDFQIHLRRGAGAYICGEETALLNSLEGKHPFPRNRPPYPVTHGFENLPTVVNNVETLANIGPILRHGPDWYRGLGLNGQAGTKVISLSGDVQCPGNYEVPFGLPLKTLLFDWAGGPPAGRSIQAVTMAGISGGFLAGDDLAVTLDDAGVRQAGTYLGAGGIIVFDDSRDMVAVAHNAMDFFAHESCGKCFPCRIGTHRLTERLNGGGPADLTAWQAEVRDIGAVMQSTSACGLGVGAPLITDSLMKYFPEQVAAYVGSRGAGG